MDKQQYNHMTKLHPFHFTPYLNNVDWLREVELEVVLDWQVTQRTAHSCNREVRVSGIQQEHVRQQLR